jgi:hypothetical protein
MKLTTQQQILLRVAAKADPKDRIDEIDRTTKLIKTINPKAFHSPFDTKHNTSLKTRKFFDEPTTLSPENYASHVVHYNQTKQHEIFARRSAKLLKS